MAYWPLHNISPNYADMKLYWDTAYSLNSKVCVSSLSNTSNVRLFSLLVSMVALLLDSILHRGAKQWDVYSKYMNMKGLFYVVSVRSSN